MKRMFSILALILVLAGSVAAQKTQDRFSTSKMSTDDTIVPIQMAFSLSGVETSKGTYSAADSKFWNNTYALNGSEDTITYHFTISTDYLQEKPDVGYRIESGSWSVAVFRDGKYIGMIFGDVTDGNIAYVSDKNKNNAVRFSTAKLVVAGGTDTFENIGDSIGVEGIFTAFTDLNSKVPVVKASVALGF